MKYHNLEFGMRREIRKHIEAAASKLKVSLQQSTIEDMVTTRISELAQETTSNKSKTVNWENLVKQASVQEEQNLQDLLVVAPKLPQEYEKKE
jgi:hypothetical protein